MHVWKQFFSWNGTSENCHYLLNMLWAARYHRAHFSRVPSHWRKGLRTFHTLCLCEFKSREEWDSRLYQNVPKLKISCSSTLRWSNYASCLGKYQKIILGPFLKVPGALNTILLVFSILKHHLLVKKCNHCYLWTPK